jgi:hypothetical protein
MDGDKGAEYQTVDISDDGRAAWGDASLGQEIVKDGERFVDADGGLEIRRLANERGEQSEIILGLALGASVIEAEGARGIGSELAAAAFEGAMLAARGCGLRRFIDNAGFSCDHFFFLEGIHPG